MSKVYLIHFKQKYKHAQHYIGWAKDVEQRIEEHKSGRGARLLAVINQVGIEWEVVKVWKGSRKLERMYKNKKHTSRFCPTCLYEKKNI